MAGMASDEPRRHAYILPAGLLRMGLLDTVVEQGIKQSILGTRIQWGVGAGLIVLGGALVPYSIITDAPAGIVGAMFLGFGLIIMLRAEVYTIARRLVEAAKA